jgi:hypothetical protein
MICSMAIWPGMLCCLPSRFISWNRRLEPQVKNASARFCTIKSLRIVSTFSTELVPSVSSTPMASPTFENRSSAITNSALRALKIAVTRMPFSPASCESGPSVAMPTPRPSTTTCFQEGSTWKPTPSGPTMLSLSPGLRVASPLVPRPTHL